MKLMHILFPFHVASLLPSRCSAYSMQRSPSQTKIQANCKILQGQANGTSERRARTMMHRRNVFGAFSTLTFAGMLPSSAISADHLPPGGTSTPRKPWAPKEALLPATRVRLLLNQAIDLSETLASTTASSSSPSSSSSKSYYSSGETQQIQSILSQLNALLVPPAQISDLKPNKSIRLAFNTYTAYLRYDDRFALTASPLEKKQMIREDRVPDVKQVITADLDLRDLYRNQVLTNVDEARAELRYQLDQFQKSMGKPVGGSESGAVAVGEVDGEELYRLLKSAGDACDEWFKLIAEEDIKEALDTVLSSGPLGNTSE